jgi:hypothetical protein
MARNADAAHIETLAMVAYYHHTEGLDVGHTFPIGRPWCSGAACEHFLVSLPYPFGPKLELLGRDDVRFLWLLPIHDSERKFWREQGPEALESRFDAAEIDFTDVNRPSVV